MDSLRQKKPNVSRNTFDYTACNMYNTEVLTSDPVILTRVAAGGSMTKKIVDIQTGEVAVGNRNVIIKSSGIGSCIAVITIDATHGIGGIAHIMLPGKAPENNSEQNKYCINAIDSLLSLMLEAGAIHENIVTCIAGGANVLQRPDDNICEANWLAVKTYLKSKELPIIKESIGGFKRRRVTLDIENNCFFCAQGDDSEKLLFRAGDSSL